MPEETPTQYSTPIPLRGNESGPVTPESANPYSRLEAVSAATERLTWLARHLTEEWELVAGADVATLLDDIAEELRSALWGDLVAVQRVQHRVTAGQLAGTWNNRLDPGESL